MKYRFSGKARTDINSIWRYTFEHWSLEQADKYYNQIIAEIKALSENPDRGRDFYGRGRKYKFSQVESHLIFYREVSSSEIEVIRILHKRMYIINRLSE
ncbi:MAG: type II toxin-antitoxin system RelE/ParE family toxin [Acidobacteria bacterium]|nr:type II toxin-antitoxin system RelE/ParE family toxin [Acidobacteriota bacterium]